MITAAIDLLVRSIPVLIGAGLVQLIIFLLKRRSELRALDAATARADAEADAVVVSSAAKSLAISDQVRDNAVRRADEAMRRAEVLETELAMCARRLAVIEREVEGLRLEVQSLRRGGKHLDADARGRSQAANLPTPDP